MKEKLALVIAVLMITPMAFLISTTTVTADDSTISPTLLAGGKYTMMTLSVTNTTGENIARILIRNASFDNPLGGQDNSWHENTGAANKVSDNWVNVADNLTWIYNEIGKVSDNLREAVAALRAAGTELMKAGENLKLAGFDLQTSARENANTAGTYMYGTGRAGDDLITAGDLIDNESINLDLIKSNADNSVADLTLAANALLGDTETNLKAAGNRLSGAENAEGDAAAALHGGKLRAASDNLELFASYIENTGKELAKYTGTGSAQVVEAGNKLDNLVAVNLQKAKEKLVFAADNLNEAGIALENIMKIKLENTRILRMNTDNATALTYIPSLVIDNIGTASDNLVTAGDNFILAGSELSEAGTALRDLSNASTFAFRAFGSAHIANADNWLIDAGENLSTITAVNFTTAANALDNFAYYLELAEDTIKETAAATSSTGWKITEPATGDVQFDALGTENHIVNGASKEFKFLWRTPTAQDNYDISIWTYNPALDVTGTTTIRVVVDATAPTLTIRVRQEGVVDQHGNPIDNVVGIVYDSGMATVTITASETLSALGTVYVWDSGNSENLLPALSMTTTDNVIYTAQITVVENWDDNNLQVRVVGPSAIDLYGQEKSSDTTSTFIADTRAPFFTDNGLTRYENLPLRNKAGTDYYYRTDNTNKRSIVGLATDNAGYRYGYGDNVAPVVTVYANDTLMALRPDNRFSGTLTLPQDINTITVRVVDWTGNENSLYIENIFIDSQQPTIAFNTVGGKTWDENSELISDNTPEIKITVTDPGGLGVAYKVGSGLWTENFLYVALDDNDNILDSTMSAPYGRLENKSPWVVSTGVFENLIDNAGKGLGDGTYWINVWASDNLMHGLENGSLASRSFTIDTVKPLTGTGYFVVSDTISGTVDNPNVYKVADRTIEGTIPSGEVGGTVKVYFGGVHQSTYDLTTTDTAWSITVTLPVGQTTKIELTLTDKAGNESNKVLYGYAMPDATPPTVAITTPESGISTDATSIILEATVTKDTWEEYSELTVRIDATSLTAPLTATNVLSATGTLTRAVELVEGTNTISVSAQDEAGNWSTVKTVTVTRTVTPWATYAIIIVIVALILAAIAIFRKR